MELVPTATAIATPNPTPETSLVAPPLPPPPRAPSCPAPSSIDGNSLSYIAVAAPLLVRFSGNTSRHVAVQIRHESTQRVSSCQASSFNWAFWVFLLVKVRSLTPPPSIKDFDESGLFGFFAWKHSINQLQMTMRSTVGSRFGEGPRATTPLQSEVVNKLSGCWRPRGGSRGRRSGEVAVDLAGAGGCRQALTTPLPPVGR
ncbi:hypothetical protein CRG98_031567 [Punica granatum]|uniref:Uncharacterized protein n=1 Tax=Punica granatum TaxID=22663 RepID=A0A2I0IWL1_PUNGR|nr:hypothetical protein CRG98_031567 [Punica granatum]